MFALFWAVMLYPYDDRMFVPPVFRLAPHKRAITRIAPTADGIHFACPIVAKMSSKAKHGRKWSQAMLKAVDMA